MNVSITTVSSPPCNYSSSDCSTWTIDQRINKIYATLQGKRKLEEVSRQFSTLQTDLDRVDYLIDLEDTGVWQPTVTESSMLPQGKSIEQSEKLRASGNTSFQQCDYRTATHLYCQSLAAAPIDSSQYALAQANRSAAVFRLLSCSQQNKHHHHLCQARQHEKLRETRRARASWTEELERAVAGDTQRALGSLHYPRHKRYRLWKRLAVVQQRLGQYYAAEKSLLSSVMDAREAALTPPTAATFLDDIDDHLRQCVLSRVKLLFDSSAESQSLEKSSESEKKSECSGLGQLSDEPSDHLPGASAAVKMEWSEKKGRYLVAQRNLKPGDTVILEQPYCWCLKKECWLTHCHGCGRRTIDSVPCNTCSNVVFCNEQCQQLTSQRVHSLSCKHLATLLHLEAGDLATLAVEAALKAGTARLQTLRRLNSENPLPQDVEQQSDIGGHMAAFQLLGHSKERKVNDLFRRTVTAVTLAKLVSQQRNSHLNDTRSELLEMSAGILHYLQSLPCNAHPITELRIRPDHQKDQLHQNEYKSSGGDLDNSGNECVAIEVVELGAAIYSTVSLMNHSCDPAVLRLTDTNQLRCSVRVLRPVAAGDELLDNYGQHTALHQLHERRERLQRQYFFMCQCEACCSDWSRNELLPDTTATALVCSRCSGLEIGATGECECRRDAEELKKSRGSCQKYLQQLARGRMPDSVTPLERCLTLLDKWTLRPSVEYNRYQEAVKLCYLAQGNSTMHW